MTAISMKNQMKTLFVAILICLASVAVQAQILFQDAFNYPNGCVETDGLWYAYSPASPHQDAFVTNNLLILNQANYDAVASPSNNFTASDPVYASFTINVSSLPTSNGGYFAQLKDTTNDYVSRIFIATTNTVVPGTYRIGISDASPYTSDAKFFPLDLATNITYQVVFSYDVGGPLAYLWVNPSSSSDSSVSPSDLVTNALQQNIVISQIAFNQYTGQGIAAIGDVMVGQNFTDVATNTPQLPVIGVQPQGVTNYSGTSATLYVAASGIGLSYQWLSNSLPLTDDGVTVSGSATPVLTLSALQNSANYTVVIANSAGSVTSLVAAVSINSTPTPPFFTLQPQSTTNSLGSSFNLIAAANGTGPLNYQWYFSPDGINTNGVGTNGPVLGFTSATFTQSGFYYVQVTGGDGTTSSSVVYVQIIPPPLVSIGYLHNLASSNAISATAIYNVQGIVTTFGPLSANTASYASYFIQDGTGGISVYIAGIGTNACPAAGTLMSITGPVTVYDGQLEIDPNVVASATNSSAIVISTNNPVPAPQLVNFQLAATNFGGAYGNQIQGSLVTITNAYFYKAKTGTAIPSTYTYYSNSYTSFYMTQGPYSASNTNSIEVYVVSYGGDSTNFSNKPEPQQAYQVTGVLEAYPKAATPEFAPTRYVDLVLVPPASFNATVTITNGAPQVAWPAMTGSTYSVYSATNLFGPWTQTFGLSYYPSTGIYTDTNATAAKFYRVSTP